MKFQNRRNLFNLVSVYTSTLLAICLFVTSQPAQATQNINGAVFTVTDAGGGSAFNCTNPGQNGVITVGPTTFSVIHQSGANFSASEVKPSVGFFDDYSGAINSNGNVSGSTQGGLSGIAADSGSFSGQILIGSGTLSITENGVRTFTNGDTCNFTLNRTGTLTSGPVASGVIYDPAFIPSSTITESVLFNIQAQGTISNINSHVSGALNGIIRSGGSRVTDNQLILEGSTGLNAGELFKVPYGVWGSYSYTDYENDLSSTAFDGNSHGFLGGIDFSFWENTVLGVAFGYDRGDIDTTFNGGQQDTDIYTIAPYFGALLSDILSIDFTVGYSKVDYDQFRVTTGRTITSSPDADRWFGAFNLNAVTYYDKWILGGRVGALFANSNIDSYTESNGIFVTDSRTKLSTVNIAGDVAYSWNDYEPFINLSYQNDFQLNEITVATGPQPSNDSDDILMTVGVRYFNNSGITGNLEYSKRFLREDFDEDRISVTIRADF